MILIDQSELTTDNQSASPNSFTSKSANSDNLEVCRDFLRGSCFRGSFCRFSHDSAPPLPSNQYTTSPSGYCGHIPSMNPILASGAQLQTAGFQRLTTYPTCAPPAAVSGPLAVSPSFTLPGKTIAKITRLHRESNLRNVVCVDCRSV